MRASSRNFVTEYNIRDKVTISIDAIELFIKNFTVSLIAASVQFIEDLRHMIPQFSVLLILLVICTFFREIIIYAGPLLAIFLKLISSVLVIIFDVVGVLLDGINTVLDYVDLDSFSLPTLPIVSPTYFYADADMLTSVESECYAFNDPWFDLLYPIRIFTSRHTCSWLRYLNPTLLRLPFHYIAGWSSFDPTPDLTIPGANCVEPSSGLLCSVVSLQFPLGEIIIPYYWIAMVIIHYRKPILMVTRIVLVFVKDMCVWSIVLLHKLLHQNKKIK